MKLTSPKNIGDVTLPTPSTQHIMLMKFNPAKHVLGEVLGSGKIRIVVIRVGVSAIATVQRRKKSVICKSTDRQRVLHRTNVRCTRDLVLSTSVPSTGRVMNITLRLGPRVSIVVRAGCVESISVLGRTNTSRIFSSRSRMTLSVTRCFLQRNNTSSRRVISRHRHVHTRLSERVPKISITNRSWSLTPLYPNENSRTQGKGHFSFPGSRRIFAKVQRRSFGFYST